MNEKRKTKRRHLLYPIRVYDAAALQQIGDLVDITPQGIMVVGEHLIPKGQTTRLRMELVNEMAEKPFIEFSARSKWCKRDVTSKMYNSGFEISGLVQEDTELILRIIESFGYSEITPES